MRHRDLFVSGFVLAGGESRRMGRPKDQLAGGCETMLERQVRLLGAVARSAAVLGPVERLAAPGLRVIPDERPGLGPLGGIATALARTRTEYNLFIGCDLPFLDSRFLRYLCREARACGADATVPESPGHQIHPTCAVYRRRALGAIRARLGRGDGRVRSFFPSVKCRVLRWPEIARAGFSALIFANMNTPDDYRSAQWRLDSRQPVLPSDEKLSWRGLGSGGR
jgi:molybdenum cofactor guanylyltransferase